MSVFKTQTSTVITTAISLCVFAGIFYLVNINLHTVGELTPQENLNTGLGSEVSLKTPVVNSTGIQESLNIKVDSNPKGRHETIKETIARIKKDVIVTGTITGVPGDETAYFQIEGMESRPFQVNTQLMDGFIIKRITTTYVLLKNQTGDEEFVLEIKS